MNIVVELESLCEVNENEHNNEVKYSLARVNTSLVIAMQKAKDNGHTISLVTARGNDIYDTPEECIANFGQLTLDWLRINKIPYSTIQFGVLSGDMYVSNNAINVDDFSDWSRGV